MKELKVTFKVPDFYKFDDLKVLIEEGAKETVAIVESGPNKAITTEIDVYANKEDLSFTFKEKDKLLHEKSEKTIQKIIRRDNFLKNKKS